MELIDVVNKLIGPITPMGDSNIDSTRFENLKATTELIEQLVNDVTWVAGYQDQPEHSVKRAGKFAAASLDSLGIK